MMISLLATADSLEGTLLENSTTSFPSLRDGADEAEQPLSVALLTLRSGFFLNDHFWRLGCLHLDVVVVSGTTFLRSELLIELCDGVVQVAFSVDNVPPVLLLPHATCASWCSSRFCDPSRLQEFQCQPSCSHTLSVLFCLFFCGWLMLWSMLVQESKATRGGNKAGGFRPGGISDLCPQIPPQRALAITQPRLPHCLSSRGAAGREPCRESGNVWQRLSIQEGT
mmetsp:Transcript_5793/g.8206  ORF Transcript_5793/g.8206 Transcript_5793/m.8206 type:complete len:225 (-) Transcript_5793:129-803(-)